MMTEPIHAALALNELPIGADVVACDIDVDGDIIIVGLGVTPAQKRYQELVAQRAALIADGVDPELLLIPQPPTTAEPPISKQLGAALKAIEHTALAAFDDQYAASIRDYADTGYESPVTEWETNFWEAGYKRGIRAALNALFDGPTHA